MDGRRLIRRAKFDGTVVSERREVAFAEMKSKSQSFIKRGRGV